MFKNLFKKSYTSINTNDHGSAGVSRAESAKADKRAAEAAQEKPEKIPSRPTAMTPESLRSFLPIFLCEVTAFKNEFFL